MSVNKIIFNAMTTVLALGISSAHAADTNSTHTMANPDGMEKCYGIAKAGMNDCGNASHNCAGEAKVDSDKANWLFVPSGLCSKIVGGNTKSS